MSSAPLARESALSNWAGPYTTNMLGRGWALASEPYRPYTGELSAGASALQQNAFQGIEGLAVPNAGTATTNLTGLGDQVAGTNFDFNRWDQSWADHYMNPYIDSALTPALDEMRRQSDIGRLNDAARLTNAGAFGGSRQAIMDSERDDNLARLMNETTTAGYRDAYNTAFGNFTSDENRRLATDQAGIGALESAAGMYGDAQRADLADFAAERQRIADMERLGETQRDIYQQGLDADRAQFEENREWPYKQTQFMQSLLQKMPLDTQSSMFTGPSDFQNAFGGLQTGLDFGTDFLDFLNAFGIGGS